MTSYLSISSIRYLFVFSSILFSTALTSCNKATPLRDVFRKQTPYEKYQQALKDTRLDQTALGHDWLMAGQRALRDSLQVNVPFRETGYFAADKPVAYGFRFNARRGERITVQVAVQSAQLVKVFVDIFEWDGTPRIITSADTSATSVSFEVKNDRLHLVRVQPELLRSGRYTLSITNGPTLGFPVQGKDSKNIGSFWGAARDGGVRKHEGIDIFAPRGTPAIAAASGIIRGVNTNNLGGKVVWLWDNQRNQTLYYAHLDSQLVQTGQRVQIGDTLGLVGTTGNARFTNPHLHFGIYNWPSGAIDPYPFVKASSGLPAEVKVRLEDAGKWHRVSVKKTTLRLSPDVKAAALQEIIRHTPLVIVGGSAHWYHVQLPTGERGYLPTGQIELARIPIQRISPKEGIPVTDQPDPTAAVMEILPKGEQVSALARFGPYWLIETAKNGLGWVSVAL